MRSTCFLLAWAPRRALGMGIANPSLSANKKLGEIFLIQFFLFLNKWACVLSDTFGFFVRNVRTNSPFRTDTEFEGYGLSKIRGLLTTPFSEFLWRLS